MTTIIRHLIPRDVGEPRSFETVAREALQGLDDAELMVTFGTWDGEDGVQFVCKVETPPGDPSSSAPPWRWWSPFFRTGDELRCILLAMIAQRYGGRVTMTGTDAGAESAVAS